MTQRIRCRTSVLLGICALLGPVGEVGAESSSALPPLGQSLSADAAAVFKEATFLYDANNFAAALSKYEQAYELDPRHDFRLHWSIALCKNNMGRYASALDSLDAYFERATLELDPANFPQAKRMADGLPFS